MEETLANEHNTSSINPQRREAWEDWMMWDDPVNGRMTQSPIGQSSPSSAEAAVLSRKRKSSADNAPEDQQVTAPPEKRPTTSNRSHNVVERRYRSNINAKIADLRDSVPALKAATNSAVQSPQNTDLGSQKLNKATILSTAVSYIHDLERDKQRLENEISELRARLSTTKREDDDVNQTPGTQHDHSLPTSPILMSKDTPSSSTSSSSSSSSWENPAQGMIQVPEDMRRLRQARHAEQPYLAHDQDEQETRNTIEIGGNGTRRARQVGKLMVGSFVGLMVVQGFDIRESGEEKHSKRSFSATPPKPPWARIMQVTVAYSPLLSSHNMQYAFLAMKAFLVLFVLGFGVFLYAFSSKPKRRKQSTAQTAVTIPSLASPLELRKNAWLTAIQTVRVPRHEMFPEWAAVNLEALHYVVRQAVGWQGYSSMTSQSEDDEVARVRAWDIAIDAQLMGGDAEISGSRLILTILAAGTLPITPARLMLKALHLRILLWKASRHGEGSFWSIVHKIAALLAAQQWRIAQSLQRDAPETAMKLPDEAESLPEHLVALLQLSCSEVLTDSIIQRAYNLAWSRPTQEDVTNMDSEMDLVVEDSTIRSPLDAICAWLSSSTLHKALFASLEDHEVNSSEVEWNFGVALHTAPRASIAQARALAANAVFVDGNRQSALSLLSEDFPSTANPGFVQPPNVMSNPTLFIDSSIPEAVGYDVTLATYCALALSKLESPEGEAAVIEEALELVSLGYQNVKDLTWLSYAAAHRLIQAVMRHERIHKHHRSLLAQIIPRLMSWLENVEKVEGVLEEHALCNRNANMRNTATRIRSMLVQLNKNIGSPGESNTTNNSTCETSTITTPGVKDEPAQSHSKVSSCHEQGNRRHSRCSQDSGYGSGET